MAALVTGKPLDCTRHSLTGSCRGLSRAPGAMSPSTNLPLVEQQPAHPTPAPPRKRRSLLWPIVSCVVAVIVIASDERDHLQRLADFDKHIAALVDSVSVHTLYTDYAERINDCDYRLLFFCERRPYPRSFGYADANPDKPGLTDVVLSSIGNLPKLPDATVYALSKRWKEGPTAFTLALMFFIGCIVLVIALLSERQFLGAVFAPFIVLLAMWLLKHAFLFAATEFGRVLQALILIGGIPAAIAMMLKFWDESREIKDSVTEVAHTLKP